MPLLSPNIQAALHAAGLADSSNSSAPPDIKKQLDRSGLSTEEILSQLQQEMTNGETSASRIRAAELGLKAHGFLKETAIPLPSINIIINDPGSPKGVNPILVPREISVD